VTIQELINEQIQSFESYGCEPFTGVADKWRRAKALYEESKPLLLYTLVSAKRDLHEKNARKQVTGAHGCSGEERDRGEERSLWFQLEEVLETLLPDAEKQLIAWVTERIAELKSSLAEELDPEIKQLQDALMAYTQDGNIGPLRTELLDLRSDAEFRLATPAEAMAAEFGQEAVDIANQAIERGIEEISSLLAIL